MQDLTVTESNIKLNVSIREWIKWTKTYTHFQYLLLFTLRHLHPVVTILWSMKSLCIVYSYMRHLVLLATSPNGSTFFSAGTLYSRPLYIYLAQTPRYSLCHPFKQTTMTRNFRLITHQEQRPCQEKHVYLPWRRYTGLSLINVHNEYIIPPTLLWTQSWSKQFPHMIKEHTYL